MKNDLSNYFSWKEREDGGGLLMRHFVLSFCGCCSFQLSVGNRFLVSIQQHKMSLSGGSESDEYIHLHSAALRSGLCVCVGVC